MREWFGGRSPWAALRCSRQPRRRFGIASDRHLPQLLPSMLSNVRAGSAGEMLLSWGLSEVEDRLKDCVDAVARRKALDGSPLAEEEIVQLARAAASVRYPLVSFFLGHETLWYTADFPAAELGTVRVVNYFAADSPSRTLAELAQRRPDIGAAIKYDPLKTRGRPIFIGPDLNGPWCLMDGTNRCCSILRGNTGEPPAISSVPIIVGICALATEWPWWK